MAKSEVVKSLLKQAGVTVLAGLLMSSAVMAEDAADAAGGVSGEAEMAVEHQQALGIVEVETGADDDTNTSSFDKDYVPELTECGFEYDQTEVPEEEVTVDPVVDPYHEVAPEPDCPECRTEPEVVELLGLPEMLQMDAGITSSATALEDLATPRAAEAREGSDRPKLWLSRQMTN